VTTLRDTAATCLLAVSLIACGGRESTAPMPTAPSGTISPQASAYLEQLLGLMQTNSIKRTTIDWARFRADVLAAAGPAQTIPETFEAIRLALRLLGDGHSSYRTSGGTVIFVPLRTCTGSSSTARPPMPANIAYVQVGSFSGSAGEATAFANRIQDAIVADDRDNLAGWIVDLRGNGGGNMWPMIAGLGPVLGEDILGFFIDPVGAETMWEYRAGASWAGGVQQQRVSSPYRLRRERPRVAVLTDGAVASSGEATVIAFRQRPNTRSFGAATCGLSTSNRGFPLSDGATLNLTVAVMADRTRTRYGDAVVPEEPVAESETVSRAVTWLLGT
jgi:carboxyl-terminal processing protease